MYSKLSRDAMRRTAAWVAALATIAALHVPPAQAGEVRTIDCFRGSSDRHRSDYGGSYGNNYGSGYGNSHSSAFSGDDRRGVGGIRRGFDGRVRHGFSGGVRQGLYGGSNSGAEAGTSSGYDSGHSNGYGISSDTGANSDSCIEIRRELTNPYVILAQPSQSPEDIKASNERDSLWRARCRPVVKEDRHGVSRYAYSAPGCDHGKYR